MHLNSMSFHFIALFPNNCRIFIRERLIGSSLFYDIDPDMEAVYTLLEIVSGIKKVTIPSGIKVI